MSDSETNLINFPDDETEIKPSTDTLVAATEASSHLSVCLISAPPNDHDIFDNNNPFDSVQNLVNRPDDPFEIVEKEACFKARHNSNLVPIEVKLGNLLSLSDDNLLDSSKYDNDTTNLESTPTKRITPKFGSDSTLGSVGSTIHQSAFSSNLDLDTESPPISMSIKWTPSDSGQSAPESALGSASSTDGGGSGAKTRSTLEQRKRLLKLSISNSTFNSPVSRRMPEKLNNNEQCLYEKDDCSSMSTLFSKTSAILSDEHMLAAESPLKLVGDDDLMSEEPPSQFVDSEKAFDADLEMLKIPMLKQLPSPITKTPPLCPFTTTRTGTAKAVIGLSDLAAIRAKLRAKREEANNNHDISLLIRNLKALICDIDTGDDNQKKKQASNLLESLSDALAPPPTNSTLMEDAVITNTRPQPIIRQGTFDMELREKEEKERLTNSTCAIPVIDDFSHMTQSTHSTHSVQSIPPFEDIPDAMIRSSATYDGDTAADNGDLVLPEVVDTFSQQQQVAEAQLQPEVNDIIEQLSKLLEQHQFTQLNDVGASGAAQTNGALNPTFIVVMNTSTAAPTESSGKQRSAYVAHYMDSSFDNGSSDLHNSSAMGRRRSQSLSSHDKVKIVQLQMQPPPQKTSAVLEQHDSPPISTPPMDTDASEFKTPSRMMLRRNSFSSGTPYTPINMKSASHFSATARRSNAEPENMSLRSNVLTTHHELQQHAALVHPMPMPHAANLNSFNPNLKKKIKPSILHDSIMKSTGPLKATIPVKKVAPMLKISPPTTSVAAIAHKGGGYNSSMNLQTKSGKMTYISTPRPLSRNAVSLGVPSSGYPNACSTPTVHRSPVRRTSTCMTKPRYSYISATPNPKPVMSSAAAAGLRRRTLSELRTKSPIKPHVSGSTTTAASKNTSRISLKMPQKSASSLNRTAQIPTPSGRAATRPSSTRSNVSGSTGANRNKENKLP